MKELIKRYNNQYRLGIPDISDEEYDSMLSKLKKELSEIEFDIFRKTLTEKSGDIKIPYILGSLEKIKAEETEVFWKWINKNQIKQLFTSLKIDGCSWYAEYRYGQLTKVTSRGNGQDGVDWTNKAMHIPSIPKTISYLKPTDIRGEFTLTGSTYQNLKFKNKRNGTVGIMNRKIVSEDVNFIESYAYQVLSENLNIVSQFNFLEAQGFQTPEYYIFSVDESLLEKLILYYNESKEKSVFDIDGLVICDKLWTNENAKFLPDHKCAFKVASEGIETSVSEIEWELSKGRLLKPVIILTPIEIDGTTVQRATGYHASYLLENGIDKGAIVSIIKSGCIIPKVIDVIKKAEEVNLPDHCPECGSSLNWYGVELQCSNESCGEIKRVEHFIKQSDIENVSEKRLAGWGIYTFDALLEWNADPSSKSQREFYNELLEKVFHVSSVQIMRNFSYDGFGQTLFDKLLASCDTLEMMNLVFGNVYSYLNFLTEGIGARTIEKAADDWKKNWEIQLEIISDSRYDYTEPAEAPKVEVKQSNLTGKTFLLTGTLSRGRTEIEKEIVSLGGKIASSVSKNLDYLLVGDKAGSKLDKARKIPSITILTEADYSNLI